MLSGGHTDGTAVAATRAARPFVRSGEPHRGDEDAGNHQRFQALAAGHRHPTRVPQRSLFQPTREGGFLLGKGSLCDAVRELPRVRTRPHRRCRCRTRRPQSTAWWSCTSSGCAVACSTTPARGPDHRVPLRALPSGRHEATRRDPRDLPELSEKVLGHGCQAANRCHPGSRSVTRERMGRVAGGPGSRHE